MFGDIINVETMDGLDKAILFSGVLAYGLLIWRCIMGLDLMQPRDGLSPAAWPTDLAFVLWLALLGCDWLWPVRATFYLINSGGAQALELAVGDEILCLPPRSYAVTTWRGAAPRDVVARAVGGEERHFRTGSGIWVVNGANATVSADFAMPPGAAGESQPNSVYLQHPDSLHVTVTAGKIYRVYSATPLERLEASDSRILARHSTGRCRDGRPMK